MLKQPEKPVLQYTIQVGDECIVAPLSLFTPELFALTGIKNAHTQKRSIGDPEDPHDENYLREIRVITLLFFNDFFLFNESCFRKKALKKI